MLFRSVSQSRYWFGTICMELSENDKSINPLPLVVVSDVTAVGGGIKVCPAGPNLNLNTELNGIAFPRY